MLASDEALLLSPEPAQVVGAVAALVDGVVARAGATGSVRAVGVSLGGSVTAAGAVVDARFLGWSDVPLGPALQEALGLPVVLDNDVLSFARAEQWFGAARGCDHFALVTVGEGVGYAYAVHGQVVDHPDAGVGTVGHLPLDPLGAAVPPGPHRLRRRDALDGVDHHPRVPRAPAPAAPGRGVRPRRGR